MAEYETEERARKERSPSFPFIPLKKAVERAEVMLKAHRRSPTRPATVGETWGYSPSSSGMIQTVAALKAYGLLDDVGRGEDRRVQLSELALRILTDQRPGAREGALAEAATRPRLLSEYAGAWLPERPSDAHCISELTLDRGFTPDAAKVFIRVFDENALYSALKEHDKTGYVIAGEASVQEQSASRALVPTQAGRTSSPAVNGQAAIGVHSVMPPAIPTATLPLPEGLVTLSIPSNLSLRSERLLKDWINVIVNLAAWKEENVGDTPTEGQRVIPSPTGS